MYVHMYAQVCDFKIKTYAIAHISKRYFSSISTIKSQHAKEKAKDKKKEDNVSRREF